MGTTTQVSTERATQKPGAATIDTKLEVIVIPVADVDRAKRFYEGLGWRLDADFSNGNDWRLVQMTPPGSACSVMFGKGFTSAVPGSVQGTFLVVDNLESERADLTKRGVTVTDVFHFAGDQLVLGAKGRETGRDPPEITKNGDFRHLRMRSLDQRGTFSRTITYLYGKIDLGDPKRP